jgi:hypothetical protein
LTQLWPLPHAFPHAPQFWLSFCSVEHVIVPAQNTLPRSQQWPVSHCWPTPHAAPPAPAQPPQLFGSLFGSMHVPLQKSGSAAGHMQLPVMHDSPPAHVVPHTPQLLLSV